MMAEIPLLLTLAETASALRLSPHTIRAFVKRGKLTPVRICRRLLFARADVERLVFLSSPQPMAGQSNGS